MTDLQSALETALFARLTDQVTGVKVFQHVPEDDPAPLIIIGAINSEDIGAKDSALDRFDIDIITEVENPGRRALNALQARVRSALDRWSPADTSEVLFGNVRQLSSDGALGPDGITYYGSQRFSVIVQPA